MHNLSITNEDYDALKALCFFERMKQIILDEGLESPRAKQTILMMLDNLLRREKEIGLYDGKKEGRSEILQQIIPFANELEVNIKEKNGKCFKPMYGIGWMEKMLYDNFQLVGRELTRILQCFKEEYGEDGYRKYIDWLQNGPDSKTLIEDISIYKQRKDIPFNIYDKY